MGAFPAGGRALIRLRGVLADAAATLIALNFIAGAIGVGRLD